MELDLSIASRVAARFGGSLKFRFIVQPLVAIFLGIRHGVQDAKDGEPFLFAWRRPASNERQPVIQAVLKRILIPLILASVLDGVDQYLLFGWVRISGAVLTGAIIIGLPYIVARAATSWIVFKRSRSTRLAGTLKDKS